MDLMSKIELDQYFEEGKDLTGTFVLIRDQKLTPEPVVVGFYRNEEPSTIEVSDEYEIFEGDILIYLKTRQHCYIDDIRHFPERNAFVIHYHTKYQHRALTNFVE